jgi:hypothetical protein
MKRFSNTRVRHAYHNNIHWAYRQHSTCEHTEFSTYQQQKNKTSIPRYATGILTILSDINILILKGYIPDEGNGFFNWPNPSSRTMALGSTQPLTEMSTRNLPGGKGQPVRKADNITAICEPIV